MGFEEEKKKQLERKDKSDEGRIDEGIEELCRKINNQEDYYTTSSCAGRIVLVKGLKEKARNVFLFKTHDKISFLQIREELEKAGKIYDGLVYFKQETCILHVSCYNLDSAMNLLNKAKFAGWKRSGLIAGKKRIILELMSTEKIEMPIINKGEVLVDGGFLKILVKEANRKLEKTREKIKKFEKLV